MGNSALVQIILDARDRTKAAFQSAASGLAGLKEGALAASVAFGAISAAGTALIGKITMYAARTEELGIVLENVTRVTGHSQEAIQQQETAIKALGITTQAARTLLTRFMAAELDVADATRVARAAQDLAVIGMRNSSEAAMDLTYAIASLQPRLLRKYGIYVTLVQVYKDAAEALSKNVDELTALEKRQAFTNAVLEAAAGYAGAYESAMTSASKQIRSFRRYLEELANQFGDFFLPVLAEAVGMATEFVKALMALPAPVKDFMMALLAAGTVSAGFIATVAALVLILPKLIAAWGFVSAAAAVFGVALAPVAIAIGVVVGALLLLKKHLDNQQRATIEAQESALELSRTYIEYVKRMENSAQGTAILSEEVWRLVKAQIASADAANIEAIAAEATAREKLLVALEAHIGALEVQGAMYETYYHGQLEAIKLLVLQDEATRILAVTRGLLTQAEVEAYKAHAEEIQRLNAMTEGYIKYRGALEAGRNSLDSWVGKLEATASVTTKAVLSAEDLAKVYEEVAKKAAQSDVALDEHVRRLIEVQAAIETLGKTLDSVSNIISKGYEQLASSIAKYGTEIVGYEQQFADQRSQIAQQGADALQQIEEAYQAARASTITQYESQIAALISSEQADRISVVSQMHEQILAVMEAANAAHAAASESAEGEQMRLAQNAHAKRLGDAAQAYQSELEELQRFIGQKLMMWATLHAQELQKTGQNYDALLRVIGEFFDTELSLTDQFTIKYQGLTRALEAGNTELTATIIEDLRNLGEAIRTEMGAAGKDQAEALTQMQGNAQAHWANTQTLTADALAALANTMLNYQGQAVAAWVAYGDKINSAMLQRQVSLRENEIKYQRSRAELVAKANAEIAAMEAAGLDEKAANRQAKLNEDLDKLKYNYETQKAWAKWHWDIQQLMQEQAHYERLAEMAEFAKKEVEIVLAQMEAKLAAMQGEIKDARVWAKIRLMLAKEVAQGVVAATRTEIDALRVRVEAQKDAVSFWDAEMDKHLANIDAISEEIQALIDAGPDLPPMPDFSQWVDDYSSGLSNAGSTVRESATKTFKEVAVDIAEAFKAAMGIFEQVAEYVSPIGLAAGMEALRKDIQEAVRQMYIAYDAIGKDGVEGAGLIAEAASQIFDAIGKAVDTFGKLEGYTAPLRSHIDSVVGDVRYVLKAVREKLLDLWGWAGERKDTVWGHMISWADAVSGVVALVGQAAEAFAKAKGYTGIMPGVAEKLAADINAVVTEMISAIGAGGGLDEFQVSWAKLAADLINVVASMIDDLGTLAAFEGGLRISAEHIKNLMDALADATDTIILATFLAGGATPIEGYQTIIDIVEAWIVENGKLVSALASLIDDLEALAAFEGGLQISAERIQNIMGALADASKVIIVAAFFAGGASPVPGYQTIIDIVEAWITENGKLVSALAQVIDDMEKLAAFEGRLTISAANVTNLVEELKSATSAILTAIGDVSDQFDEDEKYIDRLKVKWAKINAGLVSTFAGIVDDIEKIAAFEGVDEAAFGVSLTSLFDSLYWFLDEFERRASLFSGTVSEASAEIAKLMGETVSSLGSCVDPILKVAEFAVTPAEAETAIGLFFEALQLFLEKFKEKAADFQTQVDQDVADLAKIIGDTVSGIGSAVEPLINILEYNPEVVNIEAKILEFFGHLDTVLYWIEVFKDKWVVSDAALVISQRVDEMMGYLSTAVNTLSAFADYGEDNIINAVTGFLVFWGDLKDIVAIINAAEVITEGAITDASSFLDDVNEIVADLKTAMDKLNSLQYLPTEEINLVEAGKALVASLVDGFVQACSDEWERISATFYGLVNDLYDYAVNSLAPLMSMAGDALGIAFISGWINSLNNNAGALYNAIAVIIANAIATAQIPTETPAGASLSVPGFQYGGVVPGPIGRPQLAVVHGGERVIPPGRAGQGGGGDTYNYTLQATYRDTEKPTVAQQFRLLEEYSRLRG